MINSNKLYQNNTNIIKDNTLTLKRHPRIDFKKGQTLVQVNISKSFITSDNGILSPKKRGSFSLVKSYIKTSPKIVEIIFHGLNLSAKRRRLKRLSYQVDVHKSELFLCTQTRKSEYKSRIYKRRLFLISNNSKVLDSVSKFIRNFKFPDVYTGKGLFLKSQAYKTKKGKEYKK